MSENPMSDTEREALEAATKMGATFSKGDFRAGWIAHREFAARESAVPERVTAVPTEGERKSLKERDNAIASLERLRAESVIRPSAPTVRVSDQMRALGPDPAVEREVAAQIARELRGPEGRVRGPVDHMLKQPRHEITDE